MLHQLNLLLHHGLQLWGQRKPKGHLWVIHLMALFLLFPPVSLATSIFSWLDDQGIQNFGDRPQPTRDTYLTNPPSSFGERARQRLSAGTAEPSSDPITTAAAIKASIESASTGENPIKGDPAEPSPQIEREAMIPLRGPELTSACGRAYKTLGTLKRRPRATVRDEDGRERILGRTEQQAYVAQIESDIAAFCK